LARLSDIRLRRSAVSGSIPSTSNLNLGELALNTADGKVYMKKSVGGTDTVVEVGAGGGIAASFIAYEYTATANQTTFSGTDNNSNTLAYNTGTPPSVQVFMNGILLDEGSSQDYTGTNGTSVVLTTAADAGDLIQIHAYKSDVSIVSDLSFADNQKLKFGDSSDLQIYHDGNNSRVEDTGTGGLRLIGGNFVSLQSTSGENMVVATENGAVTLYHNNSAKLATTSTGIDVTGTVTADGLTVGDSSTAGNVRSYYSDGSYTDLKGYGLEFNRNSSYIRPTTDGTKNLYIGGSDASKDWNIVAFRSLNGLYMTGTQFITTDRNLVNIGSISATDLLTQNNTTITSLGARDLVTIGSGSRAGAIKINDVAGANYTIAGGGYDLTFYKNVSGTSNAAVMQFVGANASDSTPDVRVVHNLTVDGTISSGAITSTGGIESTSLQTQNIYLSTALYTLNTAGNGWDSTINRNGGNPTANLPGGITSGNITTTGYLRGPSTFTIDPAAHGDDTGTVVIAGNLQIDGTTTTINSTTLTVDDKNITLASGSANAAAANGAGFTVDIGTGTNPAITYDGTNDEWDFNKALNVSGAVFFNSDLRANNVSNKLIVKASSSNTEFHAAGSSGIVFKDDGNGQTASLDNGGNLLLNGLLSAEDNIYLTDAGTVRGKLLLNSSDRDNVELRAESLGSTMEFFTVGTRAMHIDANQNVGIATTTPNSRFTVNTTTTGDGIELQSSEVSIAKLSRAVVDSTVVASLDGVAGRPIHIGGVVNEDVILAYGGGKVIIGGTDAANANSSLTIDVNQSSNNARGLHFYGGADVTNKYISIGRTHTAGNQYINSEVRFGAEVGGNGTSFLSFATGNGQPNETTGNPERMRITSAGNVGIGTTSPADKLEVYGDGADTTIRIHEDAGTHNARLHLRRGSNDAYIENDGGLRLRTESTLTGVAPFNIINNGNVGIGTDSPVSTLDVRSTNAVGSVFRKDFNGPVADTFSKVAVTLWGQDHDDADVGTGTDQFGPMLGFGARIDDGNPNSGDVRAGISYSYNGDLTFHAKAGASVADGSYERIRIDGATGNVGIGTTSPDTNLEVDIQNGADGNGIHITSTSTTNDPTLKLTRNGSADRFQFMVRGGAGSARLGISAGTSLDSGLNLGSNNGLSIGTVTAAGSGGLLVDNDIKSNSRFGVGSGGSLSDAAIYKNSDTNTGIYWPGADQIALTTAGSSRLHINSTGGVSLGTQSQLTTGGNARLSIIDSSVQLSMGASNSDMSYIRKQGAGQFAWQTYNSGNSGILQLQPYGGNVTINTTAAVSGHALSVSGRIGGLTYSDSYLQFTGGNAVLKANDDVVIGYSGSLYVKQGGNVGVGTSDPKAEFQVYHAGIDTYSVNTSATSAAQVDTFSATEFRSARFTVQITNTTDSTYQITEILLIHDGTTPSMTEYGTIFTGSAREASFDADIVSGNVRLLATPASSDSMQFKAVRHSILV
jgi:hypothetical protein